MDFYQKAIYAIRNQDSLIFDEGRKFINQFLLTNNKYCCFCQKYSVCLEVKHWDETVECGGLIEWMYLVCEDCADESMCQTCLLPHLEPKDCPVSKSYITLLLCNPILRILPIDVQKKMYATIKENYYAYLFSE